MVSNRDLENVVSQVNVKFEELFKKIAQLEKQMEAKNASKKTRPMEAKNASKKTRPKTS
jgi:outer membrane murein-binding lipoprotein Lpp